MRGSRRRGNGLLDRSVVRLRLELIRCEMEREGVAIVGHDDSALLQIEEQFFRQMVDGERADILVLDVTHIASDRGLHIPHEEIAHVIHWNAVGAHVIKQYRFAADEGIHQYAPCFVRKSCHHENNRIFPKSVHAPTNARGELPRGRPADCFTAAFTVFFRSYNDLDGMLHLAVFVSGRGSNLRSIQRAIVEQRLDARIAVVISNRRDAPALDYASELGISARSFAGITAEQEIRWFREILESSGVNFIVLAGYMKLIPREVVADFRHRIVNIHPALLPAFGGKGMYGQHVHEAVLASGVKVSGATVHLVDEEYDRGPIVAQRCVPVRTGDTVETLAARVLEIEHQLYPEALRLFAEARVEVHGQRTIILD